MPGQPAAHRSRAKVSSPSDGCHAQGPKPGESILWRQTLRCGPQPTQGVPTWGPIPTPHPVHPPCSSSKLVCVCDSSEGCGTPGCTTKRRRAKAGSPVSCSRSRGGRVGHRSGRKAGTHASSAGGPVAKALQCCCAGPEAARLGQPRHTCTPAPPVPWHPPGAVQAGCRPTAWGRSATPRLPAGGPPRSAAPC